MQSAAICSHSAFCFSKIDAASPGFDAHKYGSTGEAPLRVLMQAEQTEHTSPKIYTIGHSNKDFAGFVALLHQVGVKALVDVRSAPYSRFAPQFSRDQLVPALEKEGIQYRFAGKHLGGRPNDPTCYKSGHVPVGKADYLHDVDYAELARKEWYQHAIDRLIAIAAQTPTVIMCSEEDHHKCHRYHLLTRTLHKRGIVVEHLPFKEQEESAQLPLFSIEDL